MAGNIANPYLFVQSNPLERIMSSPEVDAILRPLNPAGGIYSNVVDLSSWVMVHLNTTSIANFF